MQEKILGCLAGLAIGDALGMPTEFLNPSQIAEIYGWVNHFEAAPSFHPHKILPAGSITDDTGQALAIIDACLPNGEISAETAARELMAWEDSLSPEILAVIEGPSSRAALQEIRSGGSPTHSGRNGRTNGAAMRVAGIGLIHPGDLERAAGSAVQASLPTHGTCVALSGAAAVACAVSAAVVDGADLFSIIRAAKFGADYGARQGVWVWSTPLSGRIELAEQIIATSAGDEAALQNLYRYVGVDMLAPESVATAFGIVLLAQGDPMKAIQYGANIGGDTDTIAAIAGQICGALRGVSVIDAEMIKVVEEVNHLDLRKTSQLIMSMVSD